MRRLEWANALRGIAALSVLVFHYAVVFWTRQDVAAGLARRPPLYDGDEGAPRWSLALAGAPVDLGATGVAVFFLLSGYVIAISLDRYSRAGFIVGRSMRVLPTYAAGYLVSCGFIWAMGDPAGELVPTRVLAGMVPGLPLLLGVTAPADGIVWTLIIELAFYGVCLVAYRSLTTRWPVLAAVALGCVAVQVLVPPPAQLVGSTLGGLTYVALLACPFLPVMLVGVALSARRRGQIGGRTTVVLVPSLAVVHVALLSSSAVVATSVVYRLSFVVAIGAFVGVWALGDALRQRRVTDFFADISYPLYVVHPVLGYVVLSYLAGAGFPAAAAVPAAAVAAMAAAWLLHVTVEAPTHRLGQRWARRLGYRPAQPSASLV